MAQIQPSSQTVDSILKEYEEIEVPLNQRGFEWGRDQASDFWSDLMDAVDDENKRVFLGTIVLGTKEGTNACSVVDGQQRITTISLLLIAIREVEKKLKLREAATQLNNNYLGSSDIMATELKPKLKTSHRIADVYNLMVDQKWDGEFAPKIGNKHVRLQVRRIRPIYDFFSSSIRDEKFDKEDRIRQLLDTLRNRCYFVVIKISDPLEALDIFERMNARGIELNAAELLKNHLFTHQLTGEEISADWEEIFKNSDNNLARLLRYFYISHRGQVRKSELYKKLKVLVKDLGARNFLVRLKEFSERYYNFTGANSRKELEEYLKEGIGKKTKIKEYVLDGVCDSLEALQLFKVSQFLPLVSAAYDRINESENPTDADIEQFARLLRTLERFHFVNNAICRKPNNEIEKFYSDKSAEIAGSDTSLAKLVESIIAGLNARKEKIDSFTDNFTELAYDDTPLALLYYIFDRLNSSGRDGADRIRIFNTDVRISKKNYNIDHMNPRKGDERLYTYSNEGDREYIDNIGNLMAISLHSNSKAQNQPLSQEKVDKIYKKFSLKLPMVAEFVETFKSKNWAARDKIFASIEERAKAMAHKSYSETWRIS